MSINLTREQLFELWSRYGTSFESDPTEGWELADKILEADKAAEPFPWAVENRVVKGPVVALFRDREEAEEYADGFIDLRVRPVEEVLDLLH